MERNAKRNVDRRSREGEILCAAMSIFQEKGFAAARMEDVAERVGLSKPAIYLYFKNKEDLLRAAVLQTAQNAAERLEAVLHGPETSAERKLSAMLDLIYKSMVGDAKSRGFASMMPVVAVTATTFPELARYFRDECVKRLDAAVLAVIAEGVAAGVFRESGLSRHAELTIGPVMALGMRRAMFGWLDDEAEFDIEAYKAEHLRMVLSALKAS